MNELFRADALAGRRALITGASRGIGSEIATTLAGLGATVLLAANDAEGLEETANLVRAAGGQAETRFVDLTDRSAVGELADWAGELDVLINNAAPDQRPVPLAESTDDLFELQMALNFYAPLTLIRRIAPRMAERGRGSIISTSSISVVRPAPRIAAYASAKAALETLTRITAMEFAPFGVRCNAVAPATVRTQRVAPLLADEAFVANALARIPMGRFAEVDDVSRAVAWLASDASAFVTGQVLVVDGGMTTGSYNAPPIVKD